MRALALLFIFIRGRWTILIEFLYDFASPNCYVALYRLRELEKKGFFSELKFTPLFLGGLFKSTNDAPVPKGSLEYDYMARNLERLSNDLGITFKFSHSRFPINSLKTLRGSYYAKKEGKEIEYVKAVFDACWSLDQDITEDVIIQHIVSSLGLDYGSFSSFISSEEAKQMLRKDTERALQRGVFGAPTFFLDNQMYWGTPEILWYLESKSK